MDIDAALDESSSGPYVCWSLIVMNISLAVTASFVISSRFPLPASKVLLVKLTHLEGVLAIAIPCRPPTLN